MQNGFKREVLFSLLDERNRKPEARERIDREIRDEFERELSIMIVDSVRFSWKTMEFGIIQFLSVMRKVNADLKSIIRGNRGRVVSEWADNFVIVFDTPADGIETAVEMNEHLREYNKNVGKADHFGISTGIGFGSVLYVWNDVFGQEVNLASKLGEDIAGEGEILLTENAYKAMKGNAPFPLEKQEEIRTSGIAFSYYRLEY
jgi:class 3 adenylate cyclase